jgi:hypothetical protein
MEKTALYIVEFNCIGGGNQRKPREQTCQKSMKNFIT